MENNKMHYRVKQEWLEAVMADDTLTPSVKVYAFGIFKHMYGNKDWSFPGAKSIKEATALSDGHFYNYNKKLAEAGFLDVEARKGTSNLYTLKVPTSTGGNPPPPQEVGVPRDEVSPTSAGGTNTTSNPPTNPTSERTKEAPEAIADAHASSASLGSQTENESSESGHSGLLPVSTIVEIPSSLMTLDTDGHLVDSGLPQSPEDADLPSNPPGRGNTPLAEIDYTKGFNREEREQFRLLTRFLGNGPRMDKADARAQVLHEREVFAGW